MDRDALIAVVADRIGLVNESLRKSGMKARRLNDEIAELVARLAGIETRLRGLAEPAEAEEES